MISKLKLLIFGKRSHVDMTEGNITQLIITFAFPFLLGRLFQQLYNMVDTWVVGNYVSNEAFAAVGSVGAIVGFLTGFFIGLSSGSAIVISQYYGAKRYDMVQKATHTFMFATLIVCVVFTALGVIFSPALLSLLNLEPEVEKEALVYLRIYFGGISGLFIYNTGASILRAVGNSRLPFLFLVLSAIVNTVLDLVLVLVFGMGVDGVAYATIFAQGVSAFLVVLLLSRIDSPVKLHFSLLRMDKDILRKIAKTGIPVAITNSVSSFSNLLFRSYVFAFGTDCISGWTAYGKMDTILYMFVVSFSMANNTFVAQNLGKRNEERVKQGIRVSIILSAVVIGILSIIICIFAPQLVYFFNKKPEVVEYGTLFLRLINPFYVILAIQSIMGSSIRASGNSRVTMIISLTTMVGFRQLYLLIVTKFITDSLIWIVMSAIFSWILALAISFIYYKKVGLMRNHLIDDHAPSA